MVSELDVRLSNNDAAGMNNLNLNTLRIFSFAARYSSFKAAGEAMNISHGAVSQRIKQLELFLGMALFDRNPRGVSLTQAGKRYHKSIEPALVAISDATEEMQNATQEVTLHVTPSLASKWLMNRLPSFAKQFPGIRISTVALENVVDRPFGKNEVAIRHASKVRVNQGQKCRKLTELQLAAVCHPELKPARSPEIVEDLLTIPLLQDAHRRWDKIIKRTQAKAPCEIINFNRTALAIDAAINNQGVAIAPTFLIERDIRNGRLVEVWRDSEPSKEFLFLVWSGQYSQTSQLSKVISWLQSEFSDAESQT